MVKKRRKKSAVKHMPSPTRNVELRVFLPEMVVKEIDKRIGRWANTRSGVIRHILVDWVESEGEIGIW